MRRILYRVFLFINGNRIKCILFSIVVFLYTVGVSFILMFHSTALKYQDLVEEIYPAQISILNTSYNDCDVKAVPFEFINEVNKIDTIIGSNFSRTIKINPLNFKNYVIEEDNSVISTNESNYSEVEISTDIEMCDLFISGQAELLRGNIPTINLQGALIEKNLAEKNMIRCDDIIRFECIVNDQSIVIDAPVVGIYELHQPIQIANGDKYIVSPYSRLYLNYDFVNMHSNLNLTSDCYQFFLRHYNDIENTVAKINSLNSDKDSFSVIPSTYIGYIQLVKSMQNVSKIISIFSITYISFISIIYIMTLLILFRSLFKEMIILYSLGETNLSIMSQYSIQQSILVIIPSLFASIISIIFSNLISNIWLYYATQPYKDGSLLSTFDSERKVLSSSFTNNFMIRDALIALLIIVIISFIFGFIANMKINHYSPTILKSKVDI